MAELALVAAGLFGFLAVLGLVVGLAATLERRLAPTVRLVPFDEETSE